MSKDFLAEMLTGKKGAVNCVGKLYIMPTSNEVKEMPLVMLAGAVVSPEGYKLVSKENEKYCEMWECEIIIIPKRKYSSEIDKPEEKIDGTLGHVYCGYRVDQVLASDFGNPKNWGKEYFESEADK